MANNKQDFDALRRTLLGGTRTVSLSSLLLPPPPIQRGSLRDLIERSSRLLPPPPIQRGGLRDLIGRPSKIVSLKDELDEKVRDIFRSRWETRDGEDVPDPEDLKLGNDSVRLDATVLYADMAGSTALVDRYEPWF